MGVMAFLKTKPQVIFILVLLISAVPGKPGAISPGNQPLPQAVANSITVQPSQKLNKSGQSSQSLMLDQWESAHGLPQNSVVDLVRTKDGYLWLGTQEGVTRFDGIEFKNYKDMPGWANQSIFTNVIFAGNDGSLWVGTRNGLNQIKNDHITAYTKESGLPDTYITALAESLDGTIWVGTRNGVAKFNKGRFSKLTIKEGLIDNDIRAISITRDGSVWIGTEKGLTRIKDDSFENINENSGLSSNKITKVYESRDGSIWIGTEHGGLNKLKDGKFSRLTVDNGLSDNSVLSIAEDHGGKLWLGTGAGLDYLESDRVVNYSKNVKALNDVIHCLLIDNEGLLWIGSESNGLFKARTPKFVVYGKQEGIPRDDTWCVLESRDGSIWTGLGQGGGLARMKDGKVQSWSTRDGLPSNEVLSLYETKDGDIWVGTTGGLCQFVNGKFNCYTTKHGLANDTVTAIAETDDGSLWIGTYKGGSRLKDGQFDNSWVEKGLGDALIGDLMVARDGSVWFIGMPGGAFQIKNGTIKNYSLSEGLPSNQTTAIYEDATGDMWIGTYQNGLCRLRPNGKVTNYSTKQGLLENQVFDTVDDGFGNFWLTSNHGIFRIAKRQFDDLDQGKITQLTPIRYGLPDGMRSEECNGGSQPSSWKTQDGRILITTIRGLVTFDPRTIQNEFFPLQAAIQEVIADRVSTPLDREIKIGPGLQNLEIHYTALSLIAPTKIQFRYMLENWDQNWIEAAGRRTAYYNNLPPGDYVFRVSVANAAGQWGEPNAGIPIHIKKLFYQRTWFYLLSAGLIGMALFGVYSARVSRTNEKLLDKVMMSLPIAVAVIDHKGLIKLLNNQFTKSFGYTVNDISEIGQSLKYLFPDPVLLKNAQEDWHKATKSSSIPEIKSLNREWHVTRKDGSKLYVEVKVSRTGDRYIVTLNDITSRKRAEEILKSSREQMRELAARLQEAREEERAFIAREIHDELGQLLTGLKMDLKWLEKRLPQNAENTDPLRKKMVLILELVDETIVAMRRVATQFRPGVLDTLGLIAAIEWQAEEFSLRTGIICEFDQPLPQKLTANEYDTALFRIFQESLTNVTRHSEATAVKVSLIRQNGNLMLKVCDNGRGITEEEINDPHSIGLLGMRERAHIFGGEVTVTGQPGKGTIVVACIPINQNSQNPD